MNLCQWSLNTDLTGGLRPLQLNLESNTYSCISSLKANHINLILSRIEGYITQILDSLTDDDINQLNDNIDAVPKTSQEFLAHLEVIFSSNSENNKISLLFKTLENFCKNEIAIEALNAIKKEWELINRIYHEYTIDKYLPLARLDKKDLDPFLSQLEKENQLSDDETFKFKKVLSSLRPIRLQNFVKIHQVGQGAYGDVWLAEDIVNKIPVALKKLKLNEEREGFPKNAIREILLLNSLKHKNIVNLLGISYSKPPDQSNSSEDTNDKENSGMSKSKPKHYDKYGNNRYNKNRNSRDNYKRDDDKNEDDKNKNNNKEKKSEKENVWMVFEYLPFDLSGYIEAMKDPKEKYDKLTRPSVWLSMGEIKTIMRQLFRAVNFCHKNNVLHRDLKTANLLMDRDGVIKLADFGLARFLPHGKGVLTNRVVTLWYRPPELLLGSESYDFSVDLWSVGCIMAELVSGTHIFAADKEFVILKLICEHLGLPDEADLKYLRTLPLWNDKNSNPLHPEKVGSIITRHRDFEKIFTKVNQLGREGWDLLKKLFSWSPSRRITAKQALLHPWFTTEPLPKLLTNRQNIKAAHSYMTKNQRKRENTKPSQKRYEYVKYANTGDIRKVLKKQLSLTL